MTQIEPLMPEDVGAAVDLLWRLRKQRAHVAPRFWRQAEDVRARHEPFLRRLLDDPDTLALRAPHGFLIAPWRVEHYEIDDIAVPEEHWSDEGAALLRCALERGPVRVVAPRCEPRRHAVVAELVPELEQTWWNRDLEPTGSPLLGELQIAAVTAALVEAPPVYDPGGPVLVVRNASSVEALARALDAGARRGAVTAVYCQRATEADAVGLAAAGFQPLTDFFRPVRGLGH